MTAIYKIYKSLYEQTWTTTEQMIKRLVDKMRHDCDVISWRCSKARLSSAYFFSNALSKALPVQRGAPSSVASYGFTWMNWSNGAMVGGMSQAINSHLATINAHLLHCHHVQWLWSLATEATGPLNHYVLHAANKKLTLQWQKCGISF